MLPDTATACRWRSSVEQMRRDLEKLQVGSKLNTLAAMDNRAEMERNLHSAEDTVRSAQRDLAALVAERDGYVQSWHADISEKLADAIGKLSDARESLNKAQLRKQLVELRAERDATVLTVAKVSVGSVLQSGQQFITLVPADAPLEVEANISGRDDGFVHVGDPVAIKFDTFPFIQYGLAYGTVRTISADSFTAQDDQRNPTGAVPLPGNSMEPFYRARVAIDRVESAWHAARVPHRARHAGDGRHQGRQADGAAVSAGPGAAGSFRGDARAVRAADHASPANGTGVRHVIPRFGCWPRSRRPRRCGGRYG